MTEPAASRSGVLELAQRIMDDIRARGLQAGDPYLNTAEAAKRFRVGGGTVHRALQLLAGQGRLDRRQRLGTIVADPSPRPAGGPSRVQILVQEGYLRTEGLLGDGVLVGLQRRLPKAELTFRFHSADDAESAAEAAVAASRSEASGSGGGSGGCGFLLVRSTAGMQAVFAASGLPALVVGSLHPTVRGLASIDRDQGGIGRLTVERFVERGCTHTAILLRERITAGDHRLLDAAFDSLAQAGRSPAAVRVRMLPADEAAAAAAVEELLAEGPSLAKWGFLCRSRPIQAGTLVALRRTASAGAKAKRKSPRDSLEAEVVLADYYPQGGDPPETPWIEPALAPEAWGERIGDMLDRLCQGVSSPDSLRESTPVRLRLPGGGVSFHWRPGRTGG